INQPGRAKESSPVKKEEFRDPSEAKIGSAGKDRIGEYHRAPCLQIAEVGRADGIFESHAARQQRPQQFHLIKDSPSLECGLLQVQGAIDFHFRKIGGTVEDALFEGYPFSK